MLVIHFVFDGPPNSPPYTDRRTKRTMKQTMEVIRKSITEKAKFPGGVSNFWPCFSQYKDEISHGNPNPTNTLTEFEPVILPIAESAYTD